MTALQCSGAPANLFVRLRLGQRLFELGDRQKAAQWLAGVYPLEGKAPFAGDDPKYLEFIKAQLQPPPGGWPEGWRHHWRYRHAQAIGSSPDHPGPQWLWEETRAESSAERRPQATATG